MLHRPLLLAMMLGLLVGAAAALVLVVRDTPSAGTAVATSGKALIGGHFSLVDQTGKRVTEADFAGKPMLVYFGFTNCPDICPAGLQVISAALDQLGAKGEKITPVFITLDPERDTAEVLAQYVKSFHPRLVGLTGTVDEVVAVAKAYRVYFKKVPDEATPGVYSVDHSGFMYLMDGSGNFVTHFPHSIEPGKLAEALAKAL